jgi:hypothetical protein
MNIDELRRQKLIEEMNVKPDLSVDFDNKQEFKDKPTQSLIDEPSIEIPNETAVSREPSSKLPISNDDIARRQLMLKQAKQSGDDEIYLSSHPEEQDKLRLLDQEYYNKQSSAPERVPEDANFVNQAKDNQDALRRIMFSIDYKKKNKINETDGA